MKNNFRKVKSGFILGLVLFSMFAIFAPSTSAGPIKITPLIDIVYPPASENLIPLSAVLQIQLDTSLTLTGIGATTVSDASLIKDSSIPVQLTVLESESWVDASIDQSQVNLVLSEGGKSKPSYLKITVTEQAPAFTQGRVRIKATSTALDGLLFSVRPTSREFDVSFVIGYWPVVNYELTKGSFMQIGPLDTADFSVDITNIGNGYTRVACEIVEIPKGDWSVNIISSIKLASAASGLGGTTATVHFVIKPPYGFGFHNERQTFKVRFTPNYVGRPDLVGQSEEITFTVQNVGMSPGAGFEIPLIVATLVIIGLIFYLYKKRK